MHPHQVPSIAVTEVRERLTDGVTLLDVRERDEWEAGHAPDALHIPLGELAGRLDELPENDEILVVCRSGGRSARATSFLNGNGWDAFNVDTGMKGWAATGNPMVSERAGTEPSVL
ncbi:MULTISPECIES: rhodanese-like domain-containing protein [Actinoalloteichus]|uniref:rhodanese-like domain-containing protein n=1 Tax=Actinoalloteichus TaxID=65496 RepID=UPI0004AB0576|nr:rhodanese-like domain-containing protein [Actinoalloteichus caeruleus]